MKRKQHVNTNDRKAENKEPGFSPEPNIFKGRLTLGKVSIVISFGWMHWDDNLKKYRQVRLRNGGGIRIIAVAVNCTKTEIICQAKIVFFPSNMIPFGSMSDYTFDLCGFKETFIEKDITLKDLVAIWNLQKLRMYITSRRLAVTSPPSTVSYDQLSSDEDFGLYNKFMI